LPATYFEVLKRAESPHCTIESIAEVISHDPTLTVRLLQMVNSPACAMGKKVTNPAEAVAMLGLDAVKSLVLCLQVFAESAPAQDSGISSEQFWRHSFSVAKLASKIVLNCIASEGMASEAYTAGLLHNIGQIVLAANLSKEYSAVIQAARKRKVSLQEVELEQLGVTSNQVGAYLLGLWGMPLPLVEATALHHAPASASTIDFTLLTVVHVANVLASEDSKGVNGLPVPELDVDYLSTLSLPKKTDAWRKLLASTPKPPEPEKPALEMARPVPAAKKSGPKSTKKILIGFGIGAAVIAGVAFKQKVVPAAHTAISAIASVSNKDSSAPETTATNDDSKPATGSPFDSLQLQSILYSKARAVAMINGKALEVGDKIDGVKVISIDATKVALGYQGDLRVFKLPQ
jgi:HD-like signal output (HDOD) protein